jgi:hypothetical protein
MQERLHVRQPHWLEATQTQISNHRGRLSTGAGFAIAGAILVFRRRQHFLLCDSIVHVAALRSKPVYFAADEVWS